MCRLVAYLGEKLLLENVLVNPVNSIVMQSLHARESEETPTNGDGFGLGWYAPEVSPFPALFTSIFPAWNDRNLLHLTAKIQSPAFFAHVRAASAGGVSNVNCHPFIHGEWMLMHNGGIQDFIHIKRHLRHLLEDDIYHWIQGETDSEHLFALFLQLAKNKDLTKLQTVADTLLLTFQTIENLIQRYGTPGASFYNICLTDGKRLVASRYTMGGAFEPSSMHYSVGSEFVREKTRYHMLPKDGKTTCILVTSERLTDCKADWQPVPPNHLLLVDENLSVKTQKIQL